MIQDIGTLALSRKAGEEIVIGERVRVVIHRIDGARVKVNVIAPKTVPIRRGELPPRAA